MYDGAWRAIFWVGRFGKLNQTDPTMWFPNS